MNTKRERLIRVYQDRAQRNYLRARNDVDVLIEQPYRYLHLPFNARRAENAKMFQDVAAIYALTARVLAGSDEGEET